MYAAMLDKAEPLVMVSTNDWLTTFFSFLSFFFIFVFFFIIQYLKDYSTMHEVLIEGFYNTGRR